ncbi:membrane protein [Arthrobacter phage Lizalica]|uniref:Uncharacterized protein n=2 Tax=Yangvirus TaxID=2733221 RepID=A0AA48Y401_9CAUD|nr:membrane protein [Arthrobacter phage Lizalica]YP_010677837.1 membrane protein [Arthrobacter phage Tbone]QPX62397.1 hypothetical protein SEA_TBONE_66 [Arthrobacter phage Tbone]UIW13550.1 hypothetical protein SEA_LIZALICA_66 [Arthrobacter phage Lizalica]
MTDALLFALGVLAWALVLLGSVGAVAAVYWIGERWRK